MAQERLTRLGDGRYRWQSKRGPALTLTAEALVKRLVALLPPRGLHLTCFHGTFAPNAFLRATAMLASQTAPPPAPGPKPKRPRLDWATALQRTFGIDVWTCHCGGRRTVRAIVTSRVTAEAMLRSMGLSGAPRPQSAAHSPPQLALSL